MLKYAFCMIKAELQIQAWILVKLHDVFFLTSQEKKAVDTADNASGTLSWVLFPR